MANILGRYDEVKAGDKITVVDASKIDHGGRLETGKTYVVRNVDADGDFRLETGDDSYVYIVKYERRGLAKHVTDPVLERLAVLEQLVREQGDLLRQMQAERKFPNVPVPVKVVENNELRKQAIQAAADDVKNIVRGFQSLKIEFHVNEKKRAVTALAKSSVGTVLAKATAKAAPGDVFNAEIGKAIALRRAVGKNVPKTLTHAPQPDKVVIGHMMEVGEPELYEIVGRGDSVYKNKAQLGSFYGSLGKSTKPHVIMSDTKAQY